MIPGQRRLRGIRGRMPGNTVLARIGLGLGPPQLVPLWNTQNRVLNQSLGSTAKRSSTPDLSGYVQFAVSGNFTVGDTATAYSGGTISSGTYKPAPANGNLQYITNGGAFTLAAPDASNDYTIILDVENNGSAGAISYSGWTKNPSGDALDTTNAHIFRFFITKIHGHTSATIQALQ